MIFLTYHHYRHLWLMLVHCWTYLSFSHESSFYVFDLFINIASTNIIIINVHKSATRCIRHSVFELCFTFVEVVLYLACFIAVSAQDHGYFSNYRITHGYDQLFVLSKSPKYNLSFCRIRTTLASRAFQILLHMSTIYFFFPSSPP